MDIYPEDYEVCYWRKCWGLRNEILSALRDAEGDEYEIKIDADAADVIADVINGWMDPEKWETEGDSIWEYEVMAPHLEQDIINLKWLAEYLDENPETECYFYDSY